MMKQGIRETARALHQAFAWNEGFLKNTCHKATPNPSILKILQEEGCGVDTASYVRIARWINLGFSGKEIMFSLTTRQLDELVYTI